MEKKLFIVPAIIAAGSAVTWFLLKKKSGNGRTFDANSAANETPGKNQMVYDSHASYTFVSGNQKIDTIEVTCGYNSDVTTFDTVSEGFLADTDVSHAAVILNPQFKAQIEYRCYYPGEDYAALQTEQKQRPSFCVYQNSNISGHSFVEGDAYRVIIPTANIDTYVLLTVFQGPEYDDDFENLMNNDEVKSFLNSLTIKIV